MRLPLFIHAYNSPFKPPKLKFYFGKIKLGTPYFFPRRWVKFTEKDALEEATEMSRKEDTIYYGKDPMEIIDAFKNYSKAVPKKVGFDFVDLGWKTKWSDDDYRFEWSPIWSFVCCGLQLAITFVPPEKDHYWEYWLWYHFETDKKLSKRERIEDCMKRNPSTWTHYINGEKEKIDFYKLILKNKYLE